LGKKRIIKTTGDSVEGLKSRPIGQISKKKLSEGILYILATYNNTHLTLTNKNGDVVLWGSAGSYGFKGTKKSTPYAASKTAALLGEKAKLIGVQKVGVVVKGVGAGRESAIRTFANQGIDLSFIRDETPLPHNGPKPPKPRRV
jgi:small subunit ribosomal protein S11